MLCDSWKAKLDTYLDGELPEEEMRAFDAHVRGAAKDCSKAAAQSQPGMDVRGGGGRRGCGRSLDFNLCGNAVR